MTGTTALARATADRMEKNGVLYPGTYRVAVNGVTCPDHANSACLRSYIGLLAEGRTAFDEIEMRRGDRLFRDGLGLAAVPSAPTMRQRLDGAAGAFDSPLRSANSRFLSGCMHGGVVTADGMRVPLDLDVSCQNNSGSHKEGVSWTYQDYDGFAPVFAYVGTEGWMLDNELRPGSQHCQNGTPEFLERCLKSVEQIGCGKVLVRMDSGNDSEENLRLLLDRADFIVKRNLRKESLQGWLEQAREHGKAERPREGKTVWRGTQWYAIRDRDGEEAPVRLVFDVIERTILADGTRLLLPEIEVATWWTSLEKSSEAEVIELYHQHGTSEQFHSEFKGEIGLERLPSGKFATNTTVMLAGMITYNILRRIGRDALALPAGLVPLRAEISRRRVRKVIQDIIRLACKYIHTGRQAIVKLGVYCPWSGAFRALHAAYG